MDIGFVTFGGLMLPAMRNLERDLSVVSSRDRRKMD